MGNVIFWTTTALMCTVSLRGVPGNPGVFRVEPVEGDPQRMGNVAGDPEHESDWGRQQRLSDVFAGQLLLWAPATGLEPVTDYYRG